MGRVGQSTPDCSFLLIPVCLSREHQSIQDGRHCPIGLNIFISYYNYTSIQIYMKIIQAMGLERKLKAYKVLLPNMIYLHKLWRIPVYSKKLVQCQTKFNSTFNVGKKKRKIKQILSDTKNNNSLFAIRYKQE